MNESLGIHQNHLNDKHIGQIFPIDNLLHILEIADKDCSKFLNNLLTIDTDSLDIHQGKKGLILNSKGKILFTIWLFKNQYSFLMIVPTFEAKEIIDYLEKRIFLESVTINSLSSSEGKLYYYEKTSPASINKKIKTPLKDRKKFSGSFSEQELIFKLNLSGSKGYLVYHKVSPTNLINTVDTTKANKLIEMLFLEGGNLHLIKDSLITELNALSIPNLTDLVDLYKGCYPGQEIITRSHSRGQTAVHWIVGLIHKNNKNNGNTEPFLKKELKIQTKTKEVGRVIYAGYSINLEAQIGIALLHRDFASDGYEISILNHNTMTYEKCEVIHGAFIKNHNMQKKFDEAMNNGMEAYHNNDFSVAQDFFNKAIEIDSDHPNPWEALGVIREKQGNLEEAIQLNKKFAERSKESPLPRTNLSRLYMLKGWIELAEEEKQKATVLMFRASAKEKRLKGENVKLNNLKKEFEQKKKIFKQVLELDAKDDIANFGLGKILFEEKNYLAAIPYLKKTIDVKPSYSLAYSFLGKALVNTNKTNEAVTVLQKGIICAKKNGEMIPLKTMEETLRHLINE